MERRSGLPRPDNYHGRVIEARKAQERPANDGTSSNVVAGLKTAVVSRRGLAHAVEFGSRETLITRTASFHRQFRLRNAPWPGMKSMSRETPVSVRSACRGREEPDPGRSASWSGRESWAEKRRPR